MKLTLTNLTFFIFITTNSFSQEKLVTITGTIYSNNKAISDIHIVNLNNGFGTISNNNGAFKILAKQGDILLFSSIEYENKKITISKFHIQSNSLIIKLVPTVTILNEVFLHGLTGSLDIDFKKTPKDTTVKPNFVYKLSDLDKKLPGDELGYKKNVNAESFTNPLYIAGGAQGSKYNRQLENERALKRKLKKKKDFPFQLRKQLGDDFFIETLKIPEDKIYLFIDYCESKNIFTKYYNNKVLEIIEILKVESINYNEIKN
ncbi:carboxypeptidase-like regulatory domain-containing protein [Lutibacter sp. A80]|uniref:carboxypeptidase-like regulatory domain-containing protein n=1 Tax=Lutibacter sp. A80 TaxID=2918453 RepID=UPI001F057613|nr:carboxypeptidase-like regulatory domain-containing protein [Lutibacter sp. A80]UMB61334.1 carboxypeptidase-like regulatory domain-containing protein [Lutibacter sp. A80]